MEPENGKILTEVYFGMKMHRSKKIIEILYDCSSFTIWCISIQILYEAEFGSALFPRKLTVSMHRVFAPKFNPNARVFAPEFGSAHKNSAPGVQSHREIKSGVNSSAVERNLAIIKTEILPNWFSC